MAQMPPTNENFQLRSEDTEAGGLEVGAQERASLLRAPPPAL